MHGDSSSTVSPQQTRTRQYSRANLLRRKELILIFTICYAILSLTSLNYFANNDAVQNQNNKNNGQIIDLPHFVLDESSKLATQQNQNNISTIEKHTSGVGLVTSDGQWDNIDVATKHQHDIKMLGFTDANYVPIAKVWYDRLTKFGHKEHYIVANEKSAYDDLMSQHYRVLPCFIDRNDRGGECGCNIILCATSFCAYFCQLIASAHLHTCGFV